MLLIELEFSLIYYPLARANNRTVNRFQIPIQDGSADDGSADRVQLS
jgi:hypothetical protein